jgi:hypothetical protein
MVDINTMAYHFIVALSLLFWAYLYLSKRVAHKNNYGTLISHSIWSLFFNNKVSKNHSFARRVK